MLLDDSLVAAFFATTIVLMLDLPFLFPSALHEIRLLKFPQVRFLTQT